MGLEFLRYSIRNRLRYVRYKERTEIRKLSAEHSMPIVRRLRVAVRPKMVVSVRYEG